MTLDASPSQARNRRSTVPGTAPPPAPAANRLRRSFALLAAGATALVSFGAAPVHADTPDRAEPNAPVAPRITISAPSGVIPPREVTATATLTSTVASLTGTLRLELYPPPDRTSIRPCTGEPVDVEAATVVDGNAEVELTHRFTSTAETGLWYWRAHLRAPDAPSAVDHERDEMFDRLDECRSMLVQNLGGPTDPGSPTAAATAVTTQFVELIGRVPTPDELSLWTALLSGGHASVGDLVAALRGSDDHRTNVDPAVRLYQAYFLRAPDADGLRHWMRELRAGRSLASVSEFFSRSPEFHDRYGALSDAGFVDLIYTNILERGGDERGTAYWVDQLARGIRTRGDVMIGFSESPEYTAARAHAVTVSVLFALLLDRAPTDREVALYVGLLDLVPVADLAYTVGDLADELLERREHPDLPQV